MTQLPLGLDDQPRERRTSEPESFHVRSPVTPDEVISREARAKGQDAAVLAVFGSGNGLLRLTPSEVRGVLMIDAAMGGPAVPLLTSVRRSLTNLTKRGALIHYPADRRPGPHGARESTWGLAS